METLHSSFITHLARLGGALLIGASLAACDVGSKDAEERATVTVTEKQAEKPAEKKPERVVVREVVREVAARPAICADCGTVASITEVKAKGEASGAGAIMGAIAGGVIGHQVGSGKGNDAATAAGAIGGGFAGHEIEKRARSTVSYQVTVAMEDGSTRTVNVGSAAGIAVGSKVRVVGNDLHMRG